jgi:hypothetical protein
VGINKQEQIPNDEMNHLTKEKQLDDVSIVRGETMSSEIFDRDVQVQPPSFANVPISESPRFFQRQVVFCETGELTHTDQNPQ